jgi:nicotinamidase-related amidase
MMKKWEEFLTARDKQLLSASGRGAREPFGFGRSPAIIVVDDYYSTLGIEREPILESVKTWPNSCGLEGWEAIDRTVELLDVARLSDVPIVYLHGLEGFPSHWGSRGPGPKKLAHLPAEIRAKANEIVEEIAPQPGDLVIQKTAPSGFQGTPLLFQLNYLGVDTLLVVGESTSGCVRATVVDGATYRFQMGVVEECCFDRTEASHWINLFDMDQKYADVIDLAMAKRYLQNENVVAVDQSEYVQAASQ